MSDRARTRRYHLKLKTAAKRFEKELRANMMAESGSFDYIIVLDNLKPNYNIGKIFRSADAFGSHEVHLIGIDSFDPASGKGSFKWVPAKFHKSFKDCYQDLVERGYRCFTLEPEQKQLISDSELPKKSAFVFGHEEFGLSFNPADYPEIQALSIPQYGKVQSLNVSVAASVVMYEYLRQHGGST